MLQMAAETMRELAYYVTEILVERGEKLHRERAWEGDFKDALAHKLNEDPPDTERPAREVIDRAVKDVLSNTLRLDRGTRSDGGNRGERQARPTDQPTADTQFRSCKVYYTERTPQATVETIEQRLMLANNRYGAKHPAKLVLSERTYGYEEAGE